MAINPNQADLNVLQQDIPAPSEQDEIQEPETEQKDSDDTGDDEREDDLLLELVKMAEKEDEDLRYRLLQTWKRNDYYFKNIQKIFWDYEARDYRTLDSVMQELAKIGPADDIKTINIYRAYAESMISALSVETPNVEFFPDDAEEPDDIETAEAYSKISDLLEDQCSAQLMLVKALTNLYNMGVIAAYNFYKTDPNYGIIRTPGRVETKSKPIYDIRCPNCAEMIDSSVPQPRLGTYQNIECPYCGFSGQASISQRLEYVDEVVEWEETPKGRAGFDIFGPNYVKLPLYARNQESIGYLILRVEDNVAKFKTVYNEHADEIVSGGGDTYLYERWARIPPEYFGQMPKEVTTARYCWFRPWYFNSLDEDDAQFLIQKYPNGCMVTVIGECVVEKNSEKLDDHWTLTFDPRAEFVHAEPAGNALVPIQDAKNDIFNLGLQSIEYGIPETFANPKTLNFKKYGETSHSPGMISPALPPGPDKSLADGFYTVKTATLSSEYVDFDRSLDTIGQFVTGAVPSIWGGTTNVGSKTATEYTESRARALQRLQLTWKVISEFWAKLIFKCVRDYADNLREDEQYTKKQNGTFVNIWIRKSSLSGKVGHTKPVSSEQLPQSWAQKKDFIMNLIQMQIPEIGQILLHPCNVELIKQSTGMVDLYIPGENDRNKQYREYYILSNEEPVDEKTASVQVDIDVDDHMVHMQVLKNILVSPIGVALYQNNPRGYQNCIAHYRQHEIAMQAHTQSTSGQTGVGQPPQSATNTNQG